MTRLLELARDEDLGLGGEPGDLTCKVMLGKHSQLEIGLACWQQRLPHTGADAEARSQAWPDLRLTNCLVRCGIVRVQLLDPCVVLSSGVSGGCHFHQTVLIEVCNLCLSYHAMNWKYGCDRSKRGIHEQW